MCRDVMEVCARTAGQVSGLTSLSADEPRYRTQARRADKEVRIVKVGGC